MHGTSKIEMLSTQTRALTGSSVSMGERKIFLRVGPSAPHTDFVEHIAMTHNLQLFANVNMTPRKFCYGPGSARFNAKVLKCKKPKILAFDSFHAKDMCDPAPIKYNFHWNGEIQDLHTVVFTVNDKGMKSGAEVDADDVLRHVFQNGDFEHHRCMLYRNISEIHHMLSDGTVKILACGGKKLEDPIVLTEKQCLERETARKRV